MYLNEENMVKIDNVHQKEKKIYNAVANGVIILSSIGFGYLFSFLVHTELWNKAHIQFCEGKPEVVETVETETKSEEVTE